MTKKGKIIEVQGLILCENKNCSLIHNRDKNSDLNMYKITKSIYKGLGRPKIYYRETKPLIPNTLNVINWVNLAPFEHSV